MSAGWVAATVRGAALMRGGLGTGGALEVAGLPAWEPALARLADVVPHGMPEGADRAVARRAAMESWLWQLRVLAGWLPPSGAPLARLAAAPAEIAALEEHRAGMERSPRAGSAHPPLDLGSLGSVWPRAAVSSTPEQLRTLLATSVWGDPGGTTEAELALALRLGFAGRLRSLGGTLARPWAAGVAALLTTREQLVFGRSVNPASAGRADRLLGHGWREPESMEALAARLPSDARWVLDGIEDVAQLWLGEVALVRRVARDAGAVVAAGRRDRDSVVAQLALLLVDLWLVEVAIESAGRGDAGREVLDAFAA
ncbi:hypothetical protein [Nocardioides sp.]|uniref:hypothetical protein n=1 Tax=Nocardioides sp. TaxID=35761 RepID=UPI003529827F